MNRTSNGNAHSRRFTHRAATATFRYSVVGVTLTAMAFGTLGILAAPALALDDNTLPSGGQVTGGTASLDYATPGQLHVHQSSQRAVIDWASFDIGRQALTQFHQPGADAIAVNRVHGGTDPTQILGTLKANGIVMVLDANGVIFGADSRVDVGGVIASTGTIDRDAFMAGGPIQLTGIGTAGAVVNHGTISVADAGLAAFVAPTLANHGTITARLGRIALASGNTATLDLYGDGLIEVAVSDDRLQQTLANTGLLHADGGTVQITAAAASDVVDSVINVEGIVSASSATVDGGRIILRGGDIKVAGTAKIDASGAAGGGEVTIGADVRGSGTDAPARRVTLEDGAAIEADATLTGNGGKVVLYATEETIAAGRISARGAAGGSGGFIETSAASVTIADTAAIDTSSPGGHLGTWLIDPTDFTIADSGGNITTATLAAQLALNDVLIETASAGAEDGDILVENALAWTGDTTLTLKAHRNIAVNAAITNTTGGSLLLRVDKNGTGTGSVLFAGSGAVTMTGGGRTELYYNPAAFAAPTNYAAHISGDFTAWMLINDVDQLQAMNTNLAGAYALGRDIDASVTASWNGGLGFAPVGNSSVKFTGHLDGLGHVIAGLTIDRPTTSYVGLIGYANGSTIRNLRLDSASIRGKTTVGALLGRINSGTVSQAYATGDVTGSTNFVGGLIGFASDSSVTKAATEDGTIQGGQYVGGLLGSADSSTLSDSYAATTVTATVGTAGGLIGDTRNSTTISLVSSSFATGDVSGASNVGGLIGSNGGKLINSYATGAVSGNSRIGGLVGHNNGAQITNGYATGPVSGTTQVGGLVGGNGGVVGGSYWNVETSGQLTSAGGGTRLTTAEMMQMASYAGWDISDEGGAGTVWRIYEGYTAPLLAGFLTPLTVTAEDVTITDDTPWRGAGDISYAGFELGDEASVLHGTLGYSGSAEGAIDAGTYTITLDGLYSGQHGYDISYRPGTLTITKAKPAALPYDAVRIVRGTASAAMEPTPPDVMLLSPDSADETAADSSCIAALFDGTCVIH